MDLKLNNNDNNKTAINTKKQQKIYFETTNNKLENFNKNLYNNKITKNPKKKEANDKKTGSKISLITELNKLKLKVKANNYNNQVFQRNIKKSRDRLNLKGK